MIENLGLGSFAEEFSDGLRRCCLYFAQVKLTKMVSDMIMNAVC